MLGPYQAHINLDPTPALNTHLDYLLMKLVINLIKIMPRELVHSFKNESGPGGAHQLITLTSTIHVYIQPTYLCSTTVSSIPPPPHLLTLNLISSHSWDGGSSLGSGSIPSSEPSLWTARQICLLSAQSYYMLVRTREKVFFVGMP